MKELILSGRLKAEETGMTQSQTTCISLVCHCVTLEKTKFLRP